MDPAPGETSTRSRSTSAIGLVSSASPCIVFVMKIKTPAWLLGLVFLLAGCNYDVPLTAKATRKVDERLLGVWLGGDDGKDPMTVRQLDDSTYVVAMDHD